MNRAMMLLAAGVFAIAACENKPSTETKPEDPSSKSAPTAATATATTTAATTAAAPAEIADTDLSTPADFEEAAEKAISKTNYKTELTALEADIAKE
jgi:hypothetical protein